MADGFEPAGGAAQDEAGRPGPWLWQEGQWGAAASEGGRHLNPLEVPVGEEEDVGGLEVAVKDVAIVEGLHTEAHLNEEGPCGRLRQCPLALRSLQVALQVAVGA